MSLLKLIEKAKLTMEGTFVLQRGIIYKKGAIQGTFWLCLPTAVASLSAFRLHNLFNFHLSHQHMMDQLQKLIYCPELNKIITDVIKTCPVCILAPTQTLFRQCGNQRSTIYRPLQALVIDSSYLPRDNLGHSKALMVTNSFTSRICISQAEICLQQQ